MVIDAQTDLTVDVAELRLAVDRTLTGFLAGQEDLAVAPPLAEVIAALREFVLAGGKRLRPLLCYCGWLAGGGAPGHPAAVRAAASLELFHAFALIHDDIIDDADTRRGGPSLHHRLARQAPAGPPPATAASSRAGSPAGAPAPGAGSGRFAVSAAILVGDLAMAWSDALLHTSGVTADRLAAVRPILDAMRTELMYGQFLDLLGTGVLRDDVDTALTVARYKSGKYTVERPLQIGAALAGADPELQRACSAYGVPVGEAFQLRDDLLGIFGDPARTGKPDLADLRDGKATVLLAIALRRAGGEQRAVLTRLVGDPGLDPDGAARVRQVLLDTGAVAAVEDLIRQRLTAGLAALGSFRPAVAGALRELAYAATVRAT